MRSSYAVVCISLVLVGCNGWADAIPREQAEHKPEKYFMYQATAPQQAQVILVDNHRWLLQPATVELPGAQLRSVGAGGQTSLFAPPWDQPPYSKLYAPLSGHTWRQAGRID